MSCRLPHIALLALSLLALLGCEDGASGAGCVENRECELPLSCIEGVCQIECRADRDCNRGQICFESACYAPVDSCRIDNECVPFGQVCDEILGLCVPPGASSCHPTLSPCAGGEDCVEGRCLLPTRDARAPRPRVDDGGVPFLDLGRPAPDAGDAPPRPDAARPPRPDAARPVLPRDAAPPPPPDAALPAGDRAYGDPCDCASQCASGFCVENPHLPEGEGRGSCTEVCQPQVGCPGVDRCVPAEVPPDKAGCPPAGHDLQVGDRVNVCVTNETGIPCNVQDPVACRIEGTCVQPPDAIPGVIPVQAACAAGCGRDDDCPPGFNCAVQNIGGRQVQVCSPGTTVINICPGGDFLQCGQGTCPNPGGRNEADITFCLQLGQGDGYCSCSCGSSADCPAGFACSRNVIDTGDPSRAGICLPMAGYTCRPQQGGELSCPSQACAGVAEGELFGRCTAPCQADRDCPAGYVCNDVDNQGTFCVVPE
jgi:hypothetical protein